MFGLGLSQWNAALGRAGNSGPVMRSDFANGTYSGGTLANLLTVSRASSKTDLLPSSPSGFAYSTFANNVPAVTPGLGVLIEDTRTNLFINSAVPVTQTITLPATGNYTLWVNGAGSAAIAAGTATISGAGTASNGTSVTINCTVTGTVTVTKTGALNAAQLEAGAFGTSLIVTAGASGTRAADSITPAGTFSTTLTGAAATLVMSLGGVPAFGASPFALGNAGASALIYVDNTGKPASYEGAVTLATSITLALNTQFRAALAFDGTGRSLVANGGTVVTDAIPADSRASSKLGSNGGASSFINGYVRDVELYNTRIANGSLPALTQPDRIAITGLLPTGDSITQGQNGGTPSIPYPTYLSQITAPGFSALSGAGAPLNYGRAGWKLDPSAGAVSLIAKYSTWEGAIFNATTRNSILISAGTNDILAGRTAAQVYADLQTYCALARTSGYQVIVGTIIPGTSFSGATETARVAYNNLIRAGYRSFSSWLVDFDGISVFNPPVVGAYYVDSLHPTSLGDQYMAVLVPSSVGVSYVAQTNIVPPTIQGSVQNGNTLTSTTGTWNDFTAGTLTYQWLKDGVAIGGATATTYVVQAGDVGHSITVTVTDTSLYASVSATSPAAAASGSNLAPTMAATASLASQNGMPIAIVLGTVAATNAAYPQPTYTISDATVVNVDSGTGRIVYVGAIDGADGSSTEAAVTVTITATNSQGSASTTLSVERWGKNGFTPSTDGTLASDGVTTATRYNEIAAQFGNIRKSTTITAGQTRTFTVEVKQKDSARAFVMMDIRNGGNSQRVYISYSFAGNSFTTLLASGYSLASAATSVSLGGGWFRLSMSVVTNTDTLVVSEAVPNSTNTLSAPVEDPTLGCYFANPSTA